MISISQRKKWWVDTELMSKKIKLAEEWYNNNMIRYFYLYMLYIKKTSGFPKKNGRFCFKHSMVVK